MNAKSYAATNPASTSKPIGAFFRWEIAGEAVGVHLSLNVIELLERDAARAADKVAAGVLLGRAHHGRELTLIVEHYESATPERGAAESPFANPQALETMLDRWRPGRSRMSVLGFYRSGANEAVLNATDLIRPAGAASNPGEKAEQNRAFVGRRGRTNRSPGLDSCQMRFKIPSEFSFLSNLVRDGSARRLYISLVKALSFASRREFRSIAPNSQKPVRQRNHNHLNISERPRYTAHEAPVSRESKPSAPRNSAQTKFMPWLKRYQWVFFGLSALPLMVAIFVSTRNNALCSSHARRANRLRRFRPRFEAGA